MAVRWVSDTLASEKFPVYTRANAGEVYMSPVSPLGASFSWGTTAAMGEGGWRDAYVASGVMRRDEFEQDRPNTIGCFGGYAFISMSMTRLFGVRMPGMTPEVVDQQYFGDMPGIPSYESEARPGDDDPEATARCERWLASVFAREDLPELRADRDAIDRLVAARPDLASLTDQELVDRARSFGPLSRRLFCRHILVSTASGIGLASVAAALEPAGLSSRLMALMSGIGDVDSAAPSWALWGLGRVVAASPSLMAEFDRGVEGLLGRVEGLAAGGSEQAARFLGGWAEFAARFGSRGPNEWELRSHTWGTNPALALAFVERMRFAPEGESPEARNRLRAGEREAVTAEVRHALAGDPGAATGFDSALRVAQLYNAGRERAKTNCVKVVHEVRLPLRELGRRMVERGVLDAVEQVFMLVDTELDAFVEGPGAFTGLAREREVTYLHQFGLEPPFVCRGEPPASAFRPRSEARAVEVAVAGTVLSGIAGSPGLARGRARVVLDPADPRGLEPGEVLVAPFTDPAWTPLFVPAAAVVVDVGAQVTHAVIVSRELGLPCVVSVIDATRKVPDGALVEVDGTAGTVTVLPG